MLENKIPKNIPDDEEVLEILTRFCTIGYEDEDEGSRMLERLSKRHPEVGTLLFWDKRNLTCEQIFEEVKNYKPILL